MKDKALRAALQRKYGVPQKQENKTGRLRVLWSSVAAVAAVLIGFIMYNSVDEDMPVKEPVKMVAEVKESPQPSAPKPPKGGVDSDLDADSGFGLGSELAPYPPEREIAQAQNSPILDRQKSQSQSQSSELEPDPEPAEEQEVLPTGRHPMMTSGRSSLHLYRQVSSEVEKQIYALEVEYQMQRLDEEYEASKVQFIEL